MSIISVWAALTVQYRLGLPRSQPGKGDHICIEIINREFAQEVGSSMSHSISAGRYPRRERSDAS